MKDEPEIEYLTMKCSKHGEQKVHALMGGEVACSQCVKDLSEYRKQKKEQEAIERFKAGHPY